MSALVAEELPPVVSGETIDVEREVREAAWAIRAGAG
jgi:hypothetical protein